MEMGTFHGVVWYSVVQKMTEPETDHYFDSSTTQNLKIKWKFVIKEKCLSGIDERWLHSNEPFIAHEDPKSECILTKNL